MLHPPMALPFLASLRRTLVEQVHKSAGGLPSTYWLLWTGTLLNRLGTFVVPFLALYLTRERGFSAAQAGFVVSLVGAGSVFSGPLGGMLADRLGRRAALTLGLWLGSAAMVFMAFCRAPEWIRVAAFTLGLLGDLYRPSVSAAISDVVPPESRSRAFSLLYWVINLGFAIGVSLGGLVARQGFLILFLADALTTFLYGCVVWFMVPETLAKASSSRSPWPSMAPLRDKAFLSFWLPSFLVACVFFQANTALALDLGAHGFDPARFGAVMAVNGVLIVVLQPFASRLSSQWRRSTVLALGAALTGLGFGLHALPPIMPLAMLAVAVWTMGEILGATVSLAVVADLAPPSLRGGYQGAFSMNYGLAAFVGPATGGWVLGLFGREPLWAGCLALGVLAAAWHRNAGEARRRHLDQLRLQREGVSSSVD